MRISRVMYVDWSQQRVGHINFQSVLPASMNFWRPEAQAQARKIEAAPQVKDPNIGVLFDSWA